jgi:hypothetical protein
MFQLVDDTGFEIVQSGNSGLGVYRDTDTKLRRLLGYRLNVASSRYHLITSKDNSIGHELGMKYFGGTTNE